LLRRFSKLREEEGIELKDVTQSSIPAYKTGMLKKDFFDTGKYRKRTDLTERLVLDTDENFSPITEQRAPSLKKFAAPVSLPFFI
jgi:hypothetical protein